MLKDSNPGYEIQNLIKEWSQEPVYHNADIIQYKEQPWRSLYQFEKEI
jgi:hypothetical protein